MLRGVDARGRAEIAAAGRVRKLGVGEALYRHGDPADSIFVVAAGTVRLVGTRRGDAGSEVIRRASRGEVFGEEATVAEFSVRQLEASCEAEALVAEVPLVVLRRAIGRAGGAPAMEKIERALRRAATLDLLRTSSFTGRLSPMEIEALLDAARHVRVARGEHVYREGDEAKEAFLVVDGLVQAQTDDEGHPRIEAYLARGDLFGDEELREREPRATSVVAAGPTWLVALPRDVFVSIARRNAQTLEVAHRLRGGALPKPNANTTAHVFRDLYRMRVARSLLVIDQDACIRCGHCAKSCADVHDDGVSRLVRRGDKIVVASGAAKTSPLLVPNSCQHCKNPSCMVDCPTGAIGRDARGEVFIREDLCTGCSSCAKACPWDNIQMAPRRDKLDFPAVAVKCDLCKGVSAGPACVSACPTSAIARIDPSEQFAGGVPEELNSPTAISKSVMPPKVAAFPWVIGGLFAGAGLWLLPLGRWTTGIVAGVAIVMLTSYSALKRVVPLARARGNGRVARAALPRPPRVQTRESYARLSYVAHLGLGMVAAFATLAHAGARLPPNVAGAATIALAATILTGLVGGVIATWTPRMLSKVERRSVLPEELSQRPKELDDAIFRGLSGKSELTKTLFVDVLRPYKGSRLGPVLLLVSGRTLREEEGAILARLEALVSKGRGELAQRAPGLSDLVRLVVEHRAVRTQRVLTWLLRGFVVPHIAVTAAAIVLVVLHLIAVTRPPGPKAPEAQPLLSSSEVAR